MQSLVNALLLKQLHTNVRTVAVPGSMDIMVLIKHIQSMKCLTLALHSCYAVSIVFVHV